MKRRKGYNKYAALEIEETNECSKHSKKVLESLMFPMMVSGISDYNREVQDTKNKTDVNINEDAVG